MTDEPQLDYLTDEVREQKAQALHVSITTRQRALEHVFIDMGKDLYELHQTNLFEVLGYKTFDAYVAAPDVNVGRRMAYMMKGCYSTFVLLYEVDRDQLVRIGISKLDMIRPIVSGYDIEEWLCKAETLSRSDLGIEIDKHLDRLPEERENLWEDDDEAGGNGNGTAALVRALAGLLEEFLKLRPDYSNSPVVRLARRALRNANNEPLPELEGDQQVLPLEEPELDEAQSDADLEAYNMGGRNAER